MRGVFRFPAVIHFVPGVFYKAKARARVREGSDGTGAGAHKGNMILSRRILQCNLVVILCGKILARGDHPSQFLFP